MAKYLAQFFILHPLIMSLSVPSQSLPLWLSLIPDPLNNFSIDSTPATDPANGLANLSHSGSD